MSWPVAPVLLGVVRMGTGGEVVLPEELRRQAGLEPGRPVLVVRSPEGFEGLLLVEPGRAVRSANALVGGLEGLRQALGCAPNREEGVG